MQPLAGLSVLDLSWYVAGPYCTKMLADYGADVLKVERPGTGDPARAYGPFPGDIPHREKSGLFLHLNTNKKSITLDFTTDTGRAILYDLVRDADVVVENFSPSVKERHGFTYATSPRSTLASCSARSATSARPAPTGTGRPST